MKLLVLAAIVIAAAAAAAVVVPRTSGSPRSSATFYVSAAGDDLAAGTRARPWRTVARVDRAQLHAGDTVLFRGGSTFAGELIPPRSDLTFGSYGSGRANLRDGIWFAGMSGLTFRDLAVDGGSAASSISAIGSSAHGNGSTHIRITGCLLTRVRVGINSANTADADWTIADTLVRYTRDSGVIIVGHDMTLLHDAILDTGQDRSITYPKHGIYAKGPSLTLDRVTIKRFSANGISLRYRNARVEHSMIASGPIGIAWFQEDSRAGTTTIADNDISGTRASGIYVSPSDAAGSTRESFVITGNTVVAKQGNAMDVNETTGHLTLQNNDFSGPVRTP